MSIYDNYDLILFNQKIDHLMDIVNQKKLDVCEPTKTEIDAIYLIVLTFIKTNKRKIYGSVALDYLLGEKKATENIYSKYKIPDIDFYTPDPIGDLIKLCNELNEKEYKYVRGREAIHKESYSLYVNNRLYCNLTYMPKNIYNKTPFQNIDDIIIVQPQFLVIDYLRIINDPLVSYWRLKDKNAFERYFLLQKYYPFPYTNKEFDITIIDENKPILENILEFSKNRNSLIHSGGLFIYNYYIRASKVNHTNIKITDPIFYEFVSTNYKKDSLELINDLKKTYPDIVIKEYFPFFQYIGYSVAIYYNNDLVCIISDNNKKCVPYKTVLNNATDKYYIGSYNYVLMTCMINLLKYKINNDTKMKNIYYIMTSHIITMRKKYLKSNKQNIFDKSLFEDFVLDLQGSTIPPEKERQLIGEVRKKRNKPYFFTYEPIKKDVKEDGENDVEIKSELEIKYIFFFTSGNLISNSKKSILFGEEKNPEDVIEDVIEDVDEVVDILDAYTEPHLD